MRMPYLFVGLLLVSVSVSYADEVASKHAAVKTVEDFFAAVDAGDLEKASKLTASGRLASDALKQQLGKSRFVGPPIREAYVGKDIAAVVTNEAGPKDNGRGRKAYYFINLDLRDGVWLISGFKPLNGPDRVKDFVELFRKRDPDAQKVPVSGS